MSEEHIKWIFMYTTTRQKCDGQTGTSSVHKGRLWTTTMSLAVRTSRQSVKHQAWPPLSVTLGLEREWDTITQQTRLNKNDQKMQEGGTHRGWGWGGKSGESEVGRKSGADRELMKKKPLEKKWEKKNHSYFVDWGPLTARCVLLTPLQLFSSLLTCKQQIGRVRW